MPKKIPITLAKNVIYFTNILDPFKAGQIMEIHVNQFSKTIMCRAFEVFYNSDIYILKALCCHKSEKTMLEQARAEFNIASEISKINEHIAAALKIEEFKDTETDEVHIEILMEYGGETLEEYIKKISKKEIMPIIRQTIEAFACLESRGIFHSDIKPKNIVMKNGIVKIIDFGVSRDLKTQTVLQKNMTSIGTLGPQWNICHLKFSLIPENSIVGKLTYIAGE